MIDSDRFEVEWKWVLAPDPTESKLVKPSANAKPLPSHLAPHNLEASNPDYGPPVSGDPFTPGDSPQKWEEFICCEDLPRNPDRRKVDLSKENQVVYYLGKNSTETRPKFTESLQKRRNNPALHFLETIKPKPRPPQVATVPKALNHNVANRPALNNAFKQNTMPLPPPKQERPYQYKPKSDVSFLPSPLGPGAPLNTTSSVASPLGRNVSNSANLPPLQGKAPTLPNPPAATASSNLAADGACNQTTQSRPSIAQHSRQPSWQSQSSSLSMPRAAPVANMMAPTANMAGQRPPSQGSPPNPSKAQAPASNASQAQNMDHEYLNQLSKFPYIRNSFLRRPKVYKSPYIAGGGFSSDYLTSVSNSGPRWPGSGTGTAIPSATSSSGVPHILDAAPGGRPGSSAGQAQQRPPSSTSSPASATSPGQLTTFSPPQMRQTSSSSASSVQFPQQLHMQPGAQLPMMEGQYPAQNAKADQSVNMSPHRQQQQGVPQGPQSEQNPQHGQRV